ncbi:MAG: alpha/beta hydrolase [Pseudomonadota bacterium]
MLSRLGAYIDTWGWRARFERFKTGWPSNTRDNIGFFNTNKVQYRYRVEGEGQTVVFLADAPIAIEHYDELFEVFSRRYRVVVLEPASMGFSAANSDYGFGFQESTDDIVLALREIAGEQAILAFSCVGGLAGVDIAVRYPQLVKQLFLLQTTDWEGFQHWMKRNDTTGLLRVPVVGQLTMKAMAKRSAPLWIKAATGDRSKVPTMCACASQGMDNGMLFCLASYFQRYMTGPNPVGVPAQPVTIIWGQRDRTHTPLSFERAAHIAPQANVIAMPHLGHFSELEAPEEVFELLNEATAACGEKLGSL